VASGYLVQNTAAAINPTWSWTNTSDWIASITSFFGSGNNCRSRSMRGVGC
jgi:hypothetical protein